LGIAYGGENQLWIADTYNHKMKQVDPVSGICKTWLGDGTPAHLDGQRTKTRFYEPSGISLAGGYLYIADTNNHAIRRVDLQTLAVTTLSLPGLCAPNICLPEP
jgi:streptogramin lyase